MKNHFWVFLITVLFFNNVFAQKTKKNLPNILIILADDLGYHDVSYYRTKDIRTPNIDMLCNAGMRFDNFYSNSSVCSPTRASLMSGRYPEMVGVPGVIRTTPATNFGYLKPGTILLPQLLKSANYQTALVGKWNLGVESPNTPNEKGFDLFHGFLDDKMDDYYTHLRHGENFLRLDKEVITPKGHATDLFSEWAVNFINQQANNTNPFFLYLAYTAPHTPIQPKQEWLSMIQKRQPRISEKRAKLLGLIEHMDDGIGKVISALKKSGKYENTLIIFLSDNGGKLDDLANNGDIRGGKGSMYEGGLRIPAIFVWPEIIKAGSSNNERAVTMDIFPTISQIIQTETNNQLDGISLLDILKNNVNSLPERPLFFSRREGTIEFGGNTIQSVIFRNWKLLQNNPFKPYELFNLTSDPKEQNNLILSEPEQFKKLQEMLIQQIQKGGSVPWQKPATN